MAALRPVTRAVARARPSSLTAPAMHLLRFNSSSSQPPSARDLEVGELQGATFKVEPLRRVGEDPATMRARLLCTLFHSVNLPTKSPTKSPSNHPFTPSLPPSRILS